MLNEVFKQSDLASKVIQEIDANELAKQMTTLIQVLLSSGSDLQRDDRLLIDTALSLWAQLVKGETAKGKKLEIDKEFILHGLIRENTWSVRDSFFNNYQMICKESN